MKDLLCNERIKDLTSNLSRSNHFLTKAIFFDEPNQSSWFVAYHQDLSISVNEKIELEGYHNYTFKRGQYGIQHPINILESTITLRIHLDCTNEGNGALKVIPKSHLKGIVRKDSKEWSLENEFTCNVKKGSALLMKPLRLHASNRILNNQRRSVIQLEFNCHQLAKPLKWLEYESLT